MKKIKQTTKIASMALAGLLSVGALTSCDFFATQNDPQTTVMNLSLNPKVEVILDEDDKVVTVNALNEEGNLIISAEAFENVEGKDAEEVAKLFVQVSKDSGYLVAGTLSVGDNNVDISFSGDEEKAKALFNEVKAEISAYFSAENVTAKVEQVAAITEAQIKQLLEECAPYIETAEMEYKELLSTLIAQRKETAEYYSQQLKNAYYEAKAFAMKQAELETLRTHLNFLQQGAFDLLTKAYTTAGELIEATRMQLLVAEDSLYQKALAAFRTIKVEYLKARYDFLVGGANVTVQLTEEEFNQLKTRMDEAEAAIISAGEQANATLDVLKVRLENAYNQAVAKLQEYNVKANDFVTEISEKQQQKQSEFFAKFEADYAEMKALADAHWAEMESQLNGAEKAE